MKDQTKKPPLGRRVAAEEKLDEEIEAVDPASDPPANTPTSVGRPASAEAEPRGEGQAGAAWLDRAMRSSG